NHTRGLLCDHRVLEAFIPYVEIENDKVTKIELMPISLGFEKEYWQMGLPEPGPDLNILERLKKLSEPFGTKIVIRSDGIGEVIL
ncbi:MAG: CapA family protein, partial [Firmicutes bacterium]|nr:CapA family protein [Bacillota bacterium]